MNKIDIYIRLVAPLAIAAALAIHGGHLWIQKRHEEACNAQLMCVYLSLQSYCDAHRGSLPPPYLVGKDGAPMHSWRTLILPYVCYEFVYKDYRFDEPWNSPDNSRVASKVTDYACPSHGKSSKFANYVAVTGDKTLWPLPKADLTYGYRGAGEDTQWPDMEWPSKLFSNAGDRIVLAELTDSDIPWAEPRDITMDTLIGLIEEDPTGKKVSQHVRRVLMLDALGKTRVIDPSTDAGRETVLGCQ